jgi:nucleotide-binding universal stress UspA family protein
MSEAMTRILVPVDFSAHSDRALRYAATLASKFGATVELLHVVEDPFVSGAWSSEIHVADVPDLLENLIADAERKLTAAGRVVAEKGVRFAAKVVKGKPAPMIVEHAKTGRFDLIVMGTHGRTGLSHMFMGSVAERVVRTAASPVLTLRAPDTSEQKLATANAEAIA